MSVGVCTDCGGKVSSSASVCFLRPWAPFEALGSAVVLARQDHRQSR